jgi:hypothetical protein
MEPGNAPDGSTWSPRTVLELGLHAHDAQTILRKLADIEAAQPGLQPALGCAAIEPYAGAAPSTSGNTANRPMRLHVRGRIGFAPTLPSPLCLAPTLEKNPTPFRLSGDSKTHSPASDGERA